MTVTFLKKLKPEALPDPETLDKVDLKPKPSKPFWISQGI